ncbi:MULTISPECIES: hypothetical protein [Nocardia]|uniref:hypothetical protein n=1 Tax=Nocardia TaxID=1817 RepID=UPI00189604F2|nr:MULTISPECIES: hypothetical protein [Nocardia]MBF6351196.1 hypothetical protein [Nocardia flavorosea]
MARHEKAVKVSPEVREFIRQRSKAMGDQFMEFVEDRELDIDMESWPAADRLEFEARSRLLVEQWRTKAMELRRPGN